MKTLKYDLPSFLSPSIQSYSKRRNMEQEFLSHSNFSIGHRDLTKIISRIHPIRPRLLKSFKQNRQLFIASYEHQSGAGQSITRVYVTGIVLSFPRDMHAIGNSPTQMPASRTKKSRALFFWAEADSNVVAAINSALWRCFDERSRNRDELALKLGRAGKGTPDTV